MENFDYAKSVEELEVIATKVEDPATSLEEIEKCLKRSRELTELCREYLRQARENIEIQEG